MSSLSYAKLNQVEDRPHYLKVMEQINQISLQSSSIDELTERVLNAVLDVFSCDRAFFSYPIDSSVSSWPISVERSRPEWSSDAECRQEVPMNEQTQALLRNMLDLEGAAIAIGVGNELDVPEGLATTLQLRSGMNVVLVPRDDKAWVFGIQHCTEERIYSSDDRALFEALGHRIADALTSLITLENLQQSEERQRLMFELAPEALMVVDAASKQFVSLNSQAQNLFARDAAELTDHAYYELFVAVDDDEGRIKIEEYFQKVEAGELPSFEWLFSSHGAPGWIGEVRVSRVVNGGGEKIYASVVDITQRKEMEKKQALLSSALEQTADSVVITDGYGVIEYVNHGFETLSGYSRDEVIGKTPKLLKSNKHAPAFYKKLWHTINLRQVFSDIFVNRGKDGEIYFEEKTITPIVDKYGAITHFVATGKDISESIQTQERLNYLVHHDVLTELPNRMLFMDRLAQSIARAERSGLVIAVIFIDLDHFKNINDSFGHSFGDQVLISVAKRLKAAIRKGDTVGRLAGDEFAIVLDDVSSELVVSTVVENIIASFNNAIDIGGQHFHVTPSVGVSFYPNDATEGELLLQYADLAMYQAKQNGRNSYYFYADDLRKQVEYRHYLETRLRNALERNELYLLYQPQRDERTGKITSVEALLRWEHPEMGVVLPLEFIPILEETGFINEVGEWVLQVACQQIREWVDAGLEPIRIAVNISGRQIESGRLVGIVERLLKQYQLDPSWLELEVTESVLMNNEAKSGQVLNDLKDLGVRLALDDFGTGYSSLIYLKRFPIHTIKIDRAFVKDIGVCQDDELIIKGVIAMAKNLEMDVVAEGVETVGQITFLQQLGCEYLQGYAIGRPLPASAVVALVNKVESDA